MEKIFLVWTMKSKEAEITEPGKQEQELSVLKRVL